MGESGDNFSSWRRRVDLGKAVYYFASDAWRERHDALAGGKDNLYDRAQSLDKRRKMMQHWSDYLDAAASQGKAIAGSFKNRA